MQFALHGAWVTFVDVAASNLEILRRICATLQISHRCSFLHFKQLTSLHLLSGPYDVVFALGSLHHAPRELIVQEMQLILPHLRSHGSWYQLAYPLAQYRRCLMQTPLGSTSVRTSCSFDAWGQATDGKGTPWSEWYEPHKLMVTMGDSMSLDWCGHTFIAHNCSGSSDKENCPQGSGEKIHREFMWAHMIKK